MSFKKGVDDIMIKIIKQEMVLVSSSMKRKQVNKYLDYLREYFEIVYREDKPGISNLIDIYGCVTGKTREETEKEFDGKGYGDFKLAVGEAVAAELEPLQKRYGELMADKTYLDSMIKMNDEKAAYYSNKTLRKVQKKVGLTERIR